MCFKGGDLEKAKSGKRIGMAGVGNEETKHGFGLGKALKDARPSHNVGKIFTIKRK